MKSKEFGESLFDVMFRQAVIDNFEQRLDELPSNEELAKVITFSDEHNARMKKLFARESRKERLQTAAKWAKRVAAAIVIAAALTFGALMTVPEVRAVVVDTIVEWFEQFTMFTSDSSAPAQTNWEPEYIPEGFAETDRVETEELTSIIYADNAGDIIMFSYSTTINAISVNNEGVGYAQSLIDNIIYHTFQSDADEHMSSVVWDTEGCQFNVSAYLPVEQLLEVAQSIR